MPTYLNSQTPIYGSHQLTVAIKLCCYVLLLYLVVTCSAVPPLSSPRSPCLLPFNDEPSAEQVDQPTQNLRCLQHQLRAAPFLVFTTSIHPRHCHTPRFCSNMSNNWNPPLLPNKPTFVEMSRRNGPLVHKHGFKNNTLNVSTRLIDNFLGIKSQASSIKARHPSVGWSFYSALAGSCTAPALARWTSVIAIHRCRLSLVNFDESTRLPEPCVISIQVHLPRGGWLLLHVKCPQVLTIIIHDYHDSDLLSLST